MALFRQLSQSRSHLSVSGHLRCAVDLGRDGFNLFEQGGRIRINKRLMRTIGRCLVRIAERNNHLGKFRCARTTVCPVARQRDLNTADTAVLNNQVDLCLCVCDELVNRYNRGNAVVVANVGDVTIEVSQPFLEGFEVLLGQVFARNTTMEFQRSDRSYQHRCRGTNTRRTALNVDELLRTQIRAKARLCDNVVGQSKTCCCGNDTIATVGNIGERTAVYERRRAL